MIPFGFFNRFLRSAVGAITFRAATLLLGILSVTLVAPFLGNKQLGEYAVLQAAIAWTGVVAFGLPDACSGILGKFHRAGAMVTAKRYLDSSFAVIAAAAALAGFLMTIWLWTIPAMEDGRRSWPFVIGVSLALLGAPFMLVQSSLNADGEIGRGTAWAFFTVVIALIAVVAVIHAPALAQPDRLLALTIATGTASLVVRVAMYAVETRRIYGQVLPCAGLSRRRLRALMISAYPFIIINLAALAAFQIDRFVSYRFLSPSETAKLDVTMKVVLAVYTLYSVLVGKLWHLIGEAWNAGDGLRTRMVLRRAVSMASLFWLAVAAVLVPSLDRIVYAFTRGTVHVEDIWFVVTAMAYIAARGIVDAVSISIYATRRQRETVPTVIAHGVLNVPCSILGCMALGLPGIMLGQLASLLLTSGYRFPVIFLRATAERI